MPRSGAEFLETPLFPATSQCVVVSPGRAQSNSLSGLARSLVISVVDYPGRPDIAWLYSQRPERYYVLEDIRDSSSAGEVCRAYGKGDEYPY